MALTALDAAVITRDGSGERRIPIADFFRQAGRLRPDQEHNLGAGALITAVEVPVVPEARRSGYLKVRDRESYEFALCVGGGGAGHRRGQVCARPASLSAASGRCRGGCPRSNRPWSAGPRVPTCGATPPSHAADGAKPLSENGFKVELVKRTVERQLATVAGLRMTRPLPAAVVSGQPVTRVDGRLKVTGKALYAADNPGAGPRVRGFGVQHGRARQRGAHRPGGRSARPRCAARPHRLRRGQAACTTFGRCPASASPWRSWWPRRSRRPCTALPSWRCSTDPAAQLTNIDAPQAEQKPGTRTRDYARGDADDALRSAAVVTDLRYSIMRNNHNPDGDPGDRRQLGRRSAHSVGQGAEHQRGADGLCRRVRGAR